MREIDIQNTIRLALSKKGIINWRNNTGALKDINGRLVRYGLCKGSADIIGIMPGTGQFIAIEVKTPGKKPTEAQEKFLQAVRKAGGLAGVATCVEDVEEILRQGL